MLKTLGYLTSTLSVILLGIVAWKGAREDDFLMLCLVAGMASSIVGMLLRWSSFLRERAQKRRLERKADAAGANAGGTVTSLAQARRR